MNQWMYAYLAIGLLLLAAPAGALVPDTITIETDSGWVTAGGSDTATLTVQVSNSVSGNTSFRGVAVDFAANNTYGSISPAHVVTDVSGKATAVFTPGTTSGTAAITATAVHGDLGEPLTGSVDQQVDHAAPYLVKNIWYSPEVTVGQTTTIAVRVVDRYGNPVDSRREASLSTTPESIRFTVGSPAGFVVGASCEDKVSVPVDAEGNATAVLRVDTAAGENLVWIQPPAPVKSEYISILSVADGVPFRIAQAVDPASASVRANGEEMVSFIYTLYDEHDNPVAGQGLRVDALVRRGDRPEELQSALLHSNSQGQVMITYGPEDSVGVATITATAKENASVSVSQEVSFTSTEPVNMLLSASPQSMPSRDVKADSLAQLRAKVMDIKGNPVAGEEVTFEIVSNTSTPYNQTRDQALETTSATTDDNGYAVVGFYPGAFTTDRKAPGWDATATGTATVRATWGDVTRDIVLTWKNYPYLSVETEVSPETVAVNETVDVTIRLRGDGWALQPDPIDVVLVIDRSGSMSKTDVSPTRMAAAKAAASTFIGKMDPARDRVGLVSFSSTTTVNNALGDSFAAVNASLNSLQANGATQLRRGIYEAILMQKSNLDRPGVIKAVVVMSDGDWNYDGSPVGHGMGYPENSSSAYTFSGSNLEPNNYRYYDGLGGSLQRNSGSNYWRCYDGEFTNQNMSRFASDNGVKLYTITFAYSPGPTVNQTMRILATSTGGFYEHATSSGELTNIYERIAGELKTEAGVDTRMDISFDNVEVNSAPVPGNQVFDYVYAQPDSTRIYSYFSHNGSNITDPYARDDRQSWAGASPCLHFNIGTVHLHQVWETTFRLNVTKPGNINVFGSGSTISFNGGEETLPLPDTFITAVEGLMNLGMTSRTISVELDQPPLPAGQDAFSDSVPLSWNITYNGTCDIDEALAYSGDGGLSWTVFLMKTIPHDEMGGNTWKKDSTSLDASNLLPGDYLIRVVASALDTPEAMDTISTPVRIGDTSGAFIRIG